MKLNYLNFFNIAGIRFQNIAANDAVISSKINTMSENGWELAFVSSAVESDAGDKDNSGIFITRYIFKKTKRIIQNLKKSGFSAAFLLSIHYFFLMIYRLLVNGFKYS